MCGILAVFTKDKEIRSKVISSQSLLKNRGPDEFGSYEDDFVYIGHTRLSIVHPEAGQQPIYYKGWIATMNGEIYNAEPGPNETDCHHLVKTIVEDGPMAVSKMDGMFSFVLWHAESKRVIMGRDRIGITPMYYSSTVVSSLSACIQDGEAMSVPIGCVADFTWQEEPKWVKYIDEYKYVEHVGLGHTSYLRSCLTRAVSKRLMGDVPWGVLLSGGLDSSIVAAIASQVALDKRPDYPRVHSFCIGLENSPDMVQAKKLASFLGTVHTAITYTIEEGIRCLSDVIKAVETYDVTTVRASTPMWILGRAISRRGIKMVLSGEGSDELFAGYLYNLYCPDANEMENECRRKISQLYAYDCARANKSMGDWGIETRVPFLDNDVVDYAMNKMPPGSKMSGTHPDGPKAEKWFLRESFRDILPDYITDRTKAQFSDAVGSDWIDGLVSYANEKITDEQMSLASERWPYQTPDTKESYLYREIFDGIFSDVSGSEKVVIYQPSIACSSETATLWHKTFQKCLDPSGDAIQRAFKDS